MPGVSRGWGWGCGCGCGCVEEWKVSSSCKKVNTAPILKRVPDGRIVADWSWLAPVVIAEEENQCRRFPRGRVVEDPREKFGQWSTLVVPWNWTWK